MLPLGICECCFRLGGFLLAPLALLGPGGFFLPALAFTLALFFLERECRLPSGLVVDIAGWLFFAVWTRPCRFALHLISGEVSGQMGVFLEGAIRSDRAPDNDAGL